MFARTFAAPLLLIALWGCKPQDSSCFGAGTRIATPMERSRSRCCMSAIACWPSMSRAGPSDQHRQRGVPS